MKTTFFLLGTLLAVGCSTSASALPEGAAQLPGDASAVDESRAIRRADLPHLMAKHPPPDVGKPVDKAITFDRLDAIIEPGMLGRGMPAFLSIGPSGSSFYKVHTSQLPNGQNAVGVNLVGRIPAHRVTELQRLLEATDWLTAKGGEGRATHTDAAMLTVTMTRAGKTRTILLEGMRRAPYDALQRFVFDLASQEDTYHQLTLPEHRREALYIFHTNLEGALRLPGKAAPSQFIDFERFEGLFLNWLDHWDSSSTDELQAAVDLMILLNRREHVEKIARLRNDRDMNLRTTIARALPALAGEKAIPWLVEMIPSTSEARTGLVRLGAPAVPVIAEIIANDEAREEAPSIAMIRAYIDNWKSLPQPIDEKIIESVLANMQLEIRRNDLQYQRELLKLAGVAEPAPPTLSETAESFLKHLRAGDKAALMKLRDNVGSLDEWLKLRDSIDPEADLALDTLLVDKTSAFLQTRGLKTKAGEEIHVVVFLNLTRGTDWRVGPAVREPGDRTRFKDRFLESNPDAREFK